MAASAVVSLTHFDSEAHTARGRPSDICRCIKDSRIQGILFQYHYIKYHYIQYKQQKQTKDIEEMKKGQKRPEWAIP